MSKYSFDNFKKNAALETEYSSLKTDHTTVLAKAKELETKFAEAEKSLSTITAEKAEWAKATEKLSTDHTTAIDALKKEYQEKLDAVSQALEATKGSVKKEVVAALTSVGIQEGTIKDATTENVLTVDDARAKLASLKGKEAQAFYKENKPLFESQIKFGISK